MSFVDPYLLSSKELTVLEDVPEDDHGPKARIKSFAVCQHQAMFRAVESLKECRCGSESGIWNSRGFQTYKGNLW